MTLIVTVGFGLVPTNATKVRNNIVALVCTSVDGEVSHLTLQI